MLFITLVRIVETLQRLGFNTGLLSSTDHVLDRGKRDSGQGSSLQALPLQFQLLQSNWNISSHCLMEALTLTFSFQSCFQTFMSREC